MYRLIENYKREMERRQRTVGIDVYIDGVIYDRCANLYSVLKILKKKETLNDLLDIRLSVTYEDVDIITAKGLKENMTMWYATR